MATQPRLSWPPPGLEQLQGTLSPVVRRCALGGLLFTLPLLVAIATRQKFTSLGPFGTSYWIPALTSAIALLVLFGAALSLSRVLRTAAAGARLGYSRSTLLTVAADEKRDSGFVLQGARVYAHLDEKTRAHLLQTRGAAPLLFLFAMSWLPLGFSISLALALLGALGPHAMWWLTLLPSSVLTFAGLCARGLEGTLIRQAKRAAAHDDLHEVVEQEAQQWRDGLAALTPDAPAPRTVRPRPLRLAAVMVFVPVLLFAAPVIAVARLTVFGPLLASMWMPNMSQVEGRLRSLEFLRDYALPADSSVTPEQAGRAMVNLNYIGMSDVRPLQQHPTRQIAHLHEGPTPLYALTDSVGARMATHRLTASDRSILLEAAQHEANTEVTLIARAAGLDIAGTRWTGELPDTITLANLPIARFSGVREAVQIHVLRGYHQYLSGDFQGAERTMKEAVALGIRMVDNAPMLIDGLIGRVTAMNGARGLHYLYLAAGHRAEADLLSQRITAAEMMSGTKSSAGRLDVRSKVSGLADVLESPNESRPRQWEAFAIFNTFAGCINLNRAVFAENDQYNAWVERSRARLVRYPADSALFEVARRGILPHSGSRTARCAMPMNALREILSQT